ncbi:hypothetical protein TTHT_1163 [Thermotomaculum hydrothermale]|uniref:DNA-directed RNA polymerase subunit omega n=1 Tax=Thermotomaculum hydrothermale TaxID=981385 RepID=A0A7R6PHH9_9BACT|nr:DNA-directed RNA polymerase subunit omega [Thermotomaculum hydrothermale]BBB32694.1 hypothetical protein TTHT_1163 [Thermotomaculum hydrothermale]
MTAEETLKKVLENPFRLILVAGERVEQLRKGAKPKAKAPINKPTFIALEELKQGKFEIRLIEREKEEEGFSAEDLDSLVDEIEVTEE